MSASNWAKCPRCQLALDGTVRSLVQRVGGWLFLVAVRPAVPSSIMSILGGGGGTEVVGTFCSPKCVAEYAYVLAATGSAGSPS